MNQALKFLILWLSLFGFFNLAVAEDSQTKSGNWIEKGYAIKGEWSIVDRGESQIIIFNDDFKTKNGPDLKVYLSSQSITRLKGADVDRTSLKIAALKSSKGYQEYEIPAGTDLSQYKSLVIHCEAYSHLWGGSNLE